MQLHPSRIPELYTRALTVCIPYVLTSFYGPAYSEQWYKEQALDVYFVHNLQAHVKKHLHDCAKGCSHVVLWLDCDREGENICFEVLECAVPALAASRPRRHVWRARFSAISEPEIAAAMANLGDPNENEALAVDARQELDLKLRLRTSHVCVTRQLSSLL